MAKYCTMANASKYHFTVLWHGDKWKTLLKYFSNFFLIIWYIWGKFEWQRFLSVFKYKKVLKFLRGHIKKKCTKQKEISRITEKINEFHFIQMRLGPNWNGTCSILLCAIYVICACDVDIFVYNVDDQPTERPSVDNESVISCSQIQIDSYIPTVLLQISCIKIFCRLIHGPQSFRLITKSVILPSTILLLEIGNTCAYHIKKWI